MKQVKPKKHLGQHFLKDSNVSKKIADSLISKKLKTILEIGPGMGILTQHLTINKTQTFFIEIDNESITVSYTHLTLPTILLV